MGSVTEVTRPELFDPTTRARPEAEVIVSHDVADDGHISFESPDSGEPGAGEPYVTVSEFPSVSVSEIRLPSHE
jgi:hypothetical protein